ncbi:MAG: hypothetical protein ACR2RL_10340, partial [Gammaproteobacteria bacterium]
MSEAGPYHLVLDPLDGQVVPGQMVRLSLVAADKDARRLAAQGRDLVAVKSWDIEPPVNWVMQHQGRAAIAFTEAQLGTYTVNCTYLRRGRRYTATATLNVAPRRPATPEGFCIAANPPLSGAAPGQRFDFRLEHTDGAAALMGARFHWYCIKASDELGNDEAGLIDGRKLREWCGATWETTGHYKVICHYEHDEDGVAVDVEYPMSVTPLETIANTTPMVSAVAAHPAVAIVSVRRELRVLERLNAHTPAPAEKAREYADYVASRTAFADALSELLRESIPYHRLPVRATYYRTDSDRTLNERGESLQMFFYEDDDGTWTLVDWTNPTDKSAYGTYRGATPAEALNDFNLDNSYPPGHIRIEIAMAGGQPVALNEEWNTAPVSTAAFKIHRFECTTDGMARYQVVRNALDILALSSFVLAGTVTLCAPIPGSRVVSAAIWASIFSSTAASAINLYDRHSNGISNWRDDAFDTLCIASNLFGAAAMRQVWRRGGEVANEISHAGGKSFALAQFGDVSAQGVLIGVDVFTQIDGISHDPTLTPLERLRQLVKAVTTATGNSILVAFGYHGKPRDAENLDRANVHIQPETLPGQHSRAFASESGQLNHRPPRSENTTQNPDGLTVAATTPHGAPVATPRA